MLLGNYGDRWSENHAPYREEQLLFGNHSDRFCLQESFDDDALLGIDRKDVDLNDTEYYIMLYDA